MSKVKTLIIKRAKKYETKLKNKSVKKLEKQIDVVETKLLYGLNMRARRNARKTNREQFVSVLRHIKYPMNLSAEYEWPQYTGYEHVAMVLQGSLLQTAEFAINTVYMYRKIYPDITIVLSTWKGEISENQKEMLSNMRCIILENEEPEIENKGENQKRGHLNHQLYSSLKGIEILEERNIKYVLKLRNDVRCYKVDIIPYFMNLLSVFPTKSDDMKYRLISVAFSNSLIYVPFHMTDFIWFGHIQDMKNMYAIPFRTDEELKYVRNKEKDTSFLQAYNKKFKELANRQYGMSVNQDEYIDFDYRYLRINSEETYILYKYVSEFIKSIKLSEENVRYAYKQFIRDCVIVIDEMDVEAYWNKYNHSLIKSDFFPKRKGTLSHSVWLDIMLKKENK